MRVMQPGSITTLVNDIGRGAAPPQGPALAAIYDALSAIARERIRRHGAVGELRTGDLVHEAYLKLFNRPGERRWDSRRHFYGSAARAMQQVVIDVFRRLEVRRAHDPGLAVPSITLPEPFGRHDVPALLRALDELEAIDAGAAELVRLRFIVGLTMIEAAKVLGLPLRSTQRKWTLARAWLLGRMKEYGDPSG
jgi:RNA polymerase sigma factor (TIGR02999 family)